MDGRAQRRTCAAGPATSHRCLDVRIASIFTQLVNLCWSLCKWALALTFVTALAVGGYLYFRLDDEIRQQVERKLANHYRDFKVSVGSARFDPDRGIAIDDLSLTPKTTGASALQPVLTIDELYLGGNLRIEQLLTNQMQVNDVVIRHAKLHMVRSADGQWNSAALLPLPHFSDNSPRITIEDASATIDYAAGSGNKPWTLTGANLKLAPLPPVAGTAEHGRSLSDRRPRKWVVGTRFSHCRANWK